MNVETRDIESTLSCRLITSPHPRPQGLLIRRGRRLIPPVRRLPVIIIAPAGSSGSDPPVNTARSEAEAQPVRIRVVRPGCDRAAVAS